MKTPRFVSSLLVLAITGFVIFGHRGNLTCQAFYRVDKNVRIGNEVVRTEVTASPDQLEKGLGGRPCIQERQGMLFVFDRPGYYKFWMKDMRFAIDIIWLDSSKKVVSINESVQPKTYPKTFVSLLPAQYVLEIGFGQSAKIGIKMGETLQF